MSVWCSENVTGYLHPEKLRKRSWMALVNISDKRNKHISLSSLSVIGVKKPPKNKVFF